MTLKQAQISSQKSVRRILWLATLFFLSIGLTTIRVQAQSHVNLTLRILIVDKDTKRPIPKVQISIPRQGMNEHRDTLQEIRATLPDGALERTDTDFELTGKPHQLIIVKADGYVTGPPTELSDDRMRTDFANPNRLLEIQVELAKESASNPGAANVSTAGSTPDQTGRGSPEGTRKESEHLTAQSWPRRVLAGLNYGVWVWGAMTLLLIGAWILLLVVSRWFFEDITELRIANCAPWLSGVAIRPFGYRINYSLKYRRRGQADVSSERDICLRNMGEALAKLADRNVAALSIQGYVNQFGENLTSLVNPGGVAGGDGYINDIKTQISELAKSQRDPRDVSGGLDETTKYAIDAAITAAVANLKPPPQNTSSPQNAVSEPVTSPMIAAEIDVVRQNANDHAAKASYRQLLIHQSPPIRPAYLETDVSSSIEGKLTDEGIYLVHVASSQAPFVLFAEEAEGKVGRVFPNPALAFDRSTLKDVFPGLNETQFNEAKELIQPIIVRKADERRWRVERDSLVS